MAIKTKSQTGNTDDIVAAILKHPTKDLTRHIQLLENEIKTRRDQSAESMTRLGTQRLMLEQRMSNLKYSAEWGDLFHRNLLFQHISVDREIAAQAAQIQREVFDLEEKLIGLRSELELEQAKFKLVK
ncbi:hypothetical protein HQ531_02730 [bacterium]|nr:hypothetical protein [bacterium]